MSHFPFQHNRNENSPKIQRDFRLSIDVGSSDRFRNTISYDYNPSTLFRQSVAVNNFRNSLDIDLAQHFVQNVLLNKNSNSSSYFNLKNTLSELEQKILKAKKQLCRKKNILDELEQEEQGQYSDTEYEIRANNYKKKNFYQKFSQQKLSFQSTKIFTTNPIPVSSLKNTKTYYLEELYKCLHKKNKQAYEHLNISLKVIRSMPNFQPLSYMQIEDRKVNLPRKKQDKRKTLIIDIDQTIIHCQQQPNQKHDLVLPIKLQNQEYANAYITIRPYAISFFKKMSKLFEIIAFTASHSSYADIVLGQIDPDREFIQHRLYRDHCLQIHPNIYTKDLRIINRQLSQMVLVDNAPYSYIFQLENGIPILPYYKGQDQQLPKLEKYLEQIAKCQDVRQLNKQVFKLHEYSNFTDPQQILKELYFKKQ